MSKSIISEGKTTNEAIENGLKQLKVSKDMVDIKVIENGDKRSFFSILAPRIVKVELTVKESNSQSNQKEKGCKEKREIIVSQEDLDKAKESLESFFKEFEKKLSEDAKCEVGFDNKDITVKISGENIGFLIGYRGDTLYAFQNVLSAIANKNTENRVRILLDVAGYREKREKTLEDLAEKIAKTVVRTGRSVTLEPMQPYERKIIHTKLQDNPKVSTKSIGEEPRRKVVISLNK